jgi:hypothetical protein
MNRVLSYSELRVGQIWMMMVMRMGEIMMIKSMGMGMGWRSSSITLYQTPRLQKEKVKENH